MPKVTTTLLLFLSLTACGDEDPCPAGEIRIGSTCVPSSSDAGMDVTIAEVCNGLDDDMDGNIDEADPMLGESCGDATGVCTIGMTVCSEGELVCDGVQAGEELCNGLDDDCDGEIDEDTLQDFYLDEDGDGYGSGEACTMCAPEECGAGMWVTMDGDCDETCDTCYLGATEVCDDLDNNCNSLVDEGDGVRVLLYEDTDGDGYGAGPGMLGCLDDEGAAPVGLAAEDGDCGPDDERAHPGGGSYSTPILGVSALPYDFNCDGEEVFAYPFCASGGGEILPACGFVPGYCWVVLGVTPCGGPAVRRAVSGTTAIPGFSDGVCRFDSSEWEEYDLECR